MKLMIVDDNKMFRQAFLGLLNWDELGFVTVLEAVNGLHALEVLKDNPVELVITDMSMPEMNGVELIKKLKYLYPDTHVMALSNYDDFTFVKEALKLGAEDYMLKHEMSASSMLTAINTCLESIKASKTEEPEHAAMQYLEIDSFVGKMLHGQLSPEEVQAGFRIYSCRDKVENMIAVLVQLTEMDRDPYIFRQWLERHVDENHLAFQASVGKSVNLLLFTLQHINSELKIQRLIREICNGIQSHAKANSYSINIAVSGLGKGVKSVMKLYGQAMLVKDHMIYHGDKTMMFYSDELAELEEVVEPCEIIGSTVYQEGIMKDRAVFTEEIKSIFTDIKANPLEHVSLEKVMFELSTLVLRLSRIHNVNLYELVEDSRNLPQLIAEKHYLEDKETLIMEVISRIYDAAQKYTEVVNTDVRKIMRYIDEHYSDDLNLKVISDAFGFSANYLSSLFKNETGNNMTDYIKAVRIRHAKTYILERIHKTYEVAKMSGFKNTSYFCTVFKEVTGMSPKEFKDTH